MIDPIDPVVAALLGALVGAIFGGGFAWFVALRSASFSRGLAMDMWRHSDAAAGADLLRALVSELDENLTALGDGSAEPRMTGRSAWERARHLGASDAVHERLRRAYVDCAEVNRRISLLDAEAANPPIADRTEALIRSRDLSNNVRLAAAAARASIGGARASLLAEIEGLQREPS